MTIKTNKKARDLYVKHLDKLDDYANGNFGDDNCYMCAAANAHPEYVPASPISACDFCPLDDDSFRCNCEMREINLRTSIGAATDDYEIATPKSIRKHIKWMEKRINDKTDCLIYKESKK